MMSADGAVDDLFWQRFVLPEEDKRRLHLELPWSGSYRWFRSGNIIDLWRYRSPADKARIIRVLLAKR
jgi:hypothetical protein